MKILLIVAFLCLGNLARASEIAFIVEDNGTEMSQSISDEAYTIHLTESFAIMDAAVEQQVASMNLTPAKKFHLTLIGVGLGANGDIGVGPFKIGAGIRQRAYYMRSL